MIDNEEEVRDFFSLYRFEVGKDIVFNLGYGG